MLADDSGLTPLEFESVEWSKLGTSAPLATVAFEDQRFADHFGLDLKAIQRAVDEKGDRAYLRGASTICIRCIKGR